MSDEETAGAVQSQVDGEQQTRARKLVAGQTETSTETDANATGAEAGGDQSADGGTETKVAPGTPDKALQKMQQDLSATNRKLDALLEKRDSGQELTAAEIAQIERGKQRVDKIRLTIADEYGLSEDEKAVREQLLELTDDRNVVGAVAEELQQTRAELSVATTELRWIRAEKTYPHTKVRDVWTNAVADAKESVTTKFAGVWDSFTPEQQQAALEGEANELFKTRCTAVEAKAKNTNVKPGQQPAGTQAAAATGTRSTLATSVGAGAAVANPLEAQLARARRLVRKSED